MKKNEELFYLIKSLSKSEKRYFRLLTTGGEEVEFLLLFEAMDEQREYDEVAIKKQFQGKAFVRQLTTMKNYLRHKILYALRSYHAHLSVATELYDMLKNVEILFHKGLYTLCESELHRAEKKAERFQQYTALFHVLDWKRKVHHALHPRDFTTVKPLVERQREALGTTVEYLELLMANFNPPPLPFSHKPSPSLYNYTLQELLTYQHCLRERKQKKAKTVLEKLLKKWEQHPELQVEYYTSYLSVSSNYIATLIFEGALEQALQQLEKVKAFSLAIKPASALLVKEILRMFNSEVEIYRDMKNFRKAETLMPCIEKYVRSHWSIVPANYWLSFRFQFAHIHFLGKQYAKALHWINDILNDKSKSHEGNLLTYTLWLNLLVHFELGNAIAMEYYIEAMRKYLKKRKNIAPYEKLLLRFLSKTVGVQGQKERSEAFRAVAAQLREQHLPSDVAGYIDFPAWAEEKVRI